MDAQFVDRLLTCSDCHGEFIFTAGEQLFFYDKQFKNDPKRCKPCKSRRSGLAAAANGLSGPAAAGLSRTETRTECSECGIETTVPFKPTQGRPVLCRKCFQMKSRAVPVSTTVDTPAILSTLAPSDTTAAALACASHTNGDQLSPDAATVAAASMASASAVSSVATAADLASIAGATIGNAVNPTAIPTQLLSATDSALPERLTWADDKVDA